MSHMRRREFMMLLGGAAAWPVAAGAQQGDLVRRVGVLLPFTEGYPEAPVRLGAFQQGLQRLGWIDGRNMRIEYRWGAGDTDRIRRYAAELAALAPDVIVAPGSAAAGVVRSPTARLPPSFA
jgi:hypothetical protein